MDFIYESVGILDKYRYSHKLPTLEADKPPFDENKHLKVDILDIDDFVKKNDCPEVTNPVFFIRDGIPTPDGLLSNELFGITKEERANIYGYIDLQGTFMHPLVYKLWGRMDGSIKNIIHGLKAYSLDSNGYIKEDPNGETGINFLVKNIDKIKIKQTDSYDRKNNIAFIMKNKNKIFIKKMIVQPPYYRDVLSGKGRVEIGQLNKYYASLLMSCKSLKETQDIGFSLGDATKGRVQETLLSIYKCLTGTSDVPEDGVGLSGKLGLIAGTALAKTADYGTRLVLSAPELKVERLEDMMVDAQHCALPLASAVVNFKPFVVFAIKRFFENEFGGGNTIEVIRNGKPVLATVKEPEMLFSDQMIEQQIKKFVYSFSGRFEPVMIPATLENGQTLQVAARFKGRHLTAQQVAAGDTKGESSLINRRLTWCDVLFMATVEATQDKHVLITRYPIDSAYNQLVSKPRISTIKETEPIYVNGTFYRWYPKIREDDVGSNTSNRFIDTLNISNLVLGGMGADYRRLPL